MMKRIALSIILLLAPVAVRAQQVISTHADLATVNGKTGTLTTNGDIVALAISGAQWATARLTTTIAGSAVQTAEISLDGGNNWIFSAYAKRLDFITANQQVFSLNLAAPSVGSIYEIPLPSNATHMRTRCSGSGTTSTVTLSGGTPYVPGTPVVAVLYDATVTAGGANNTGTLEGSGWSTVSWDIVVATAATGLLNINDVDDAGTPVVIASVASLAIGTYAGALGTGVSMGTAITPITGLTQVQLPRRFGFALAGATTSSIRLRVVARR